MLAIDTMTPPVTQQSVRDPSSMYPRLINTITTTTLRQNHSHPTTKFRLGRDPRVNTVCESNASIRRAGVVVYTWRNNRFWFCLGIDKKTRDLSDFGGGRKRYESPIECAYREFTEETCGVFSECVPSINTLRDSFVLVGRTNIVCWVYVKPEWIDRAEAMFSTLRGSNHFQHRRHLEHLGVKWLIEDHFWIYAFGSRRYCMWSFLQDFLRSNTTSLELKVYLTTMIVTTSRVVDTSHISTIGEGITGS